MKRVRKPRHQPLRLTLVRALRLYFALTRSYCGLTLAELEDEAGCSRRQLYRYLDALERAGVVMSKTWSDRRRVLRRVEYINGRRIRIA